MDQQQPLLDLEQHQHHKITKLVFALSDVCGDCPCLKPEDMPLHPELHGYVPDSSRFFFFPIDFGASFVGPVIKLRLRQQRELGDREFLKAFYYPGGKRWTTPPSCNNKRNKEKINCIESLF